MITDLPSQPHAIDLLLRYARLHPSDKSAIKRKMDDAVVAKLRAVEGLTRGVEAVSLRRLDDSYPHPALLTEDSTDGVRAYWNRVLQKMSENSNVAGRSPRLLKAYINSQLN